MSTDLQDKIDEVYELGRDAANAVEQGFALDQGEFLPQKEKLSKEIEQLVTENRENDRLRGRKLELSRMMGLIGKNPNIFTREYLKGRHDNIDRRIKALQERKSQ